MVSPPAAANPQPPRRPQNRTFLYLLLLFFSIFGGFIFFVFRESDSDKALKTIESCGSAAELSQVWTKHKADLQDDEQAVLTVRRKLVALHPSEKEMEEVLRQLPPRPQSLNVVVVPDLSNRVLTSPAQSQTDKELILKAWEVFEKKTKIGTDGQDKFRVNLTDPSQAAQQLNSLIANSLRFDLHDNKPGMANRVYFQSKGSAFQTNLAQLYTLATQSPTSGADYWTYINQYWPNRYQKSTPFREYRNLLIIITDGYLEAEPQPKKIKCYTSDTKTRQKTATIYAQLQRQGLTPKQALTTALDSAKAAPIPSCATDLTGVEVLVLEVTPRLKGSPIDGEILKHEWGTWLKSMNATLPQNFFLLHQAATDDAKQQIADFIDPSRKEE